MSEANTEATVKHIPFVSGAKTEGGHYQEYCEHALNFFNRAYKECGEVCEFDIGVGIRKFLLVGPELQEQVLRAPEEEMSAAEAYQFMVTVFGPWVQYARPFETEQQQLKMHAKGLHNSRMKNYAPVVTREVEDWIGTWDDEGEMDFVDAFADLTIKTSTHCLLGAQFRYTLTEEFADLYHELGAATTAEATADTNAGQAGDMARQRLEDLISERVRARRDSSEQFEDMLQLYMDATYLDGSKLSDKEISGMVIWFMFAGHHTSANAAAWMMVELARNPGYAIQIRDEIDKVYAEKGEVDHKGLRDMPVLQGFLTETLRCHPPLNVLTRRVKKQFEYDGYVIPEGSEVVLAPSISHHLPEYFPNPNVFDPLRPEPENMFAYIPFGGGPRKCVGNMFAILQVKCIFSALFRDFYFELVNSPDSYTEIMPSLILRPSDPCIIRYKRRKK
jgi:sterol 14-demethylase